MNDRADLKSSRIGKVTCGVVLLSPLLVSCVIPNLDLEDYPTHWAALAPVPWQTCADVVGEYENFGEGNGPTDLASVFFGAMPVSNVTSVRLEQPMNRCLTVAAVNQGEILLQQTFSPIDTDITCTEDGIKLTGRGFAVFLQRSTDEALVVRSVEESSEDVSPAPVILYERVRRWSRFTSTPTPVKKEVRDE